MESQSCCVRVAGGSARTIVLCVHALLPLFCKVLSFNNYQLFMKNWFVRFEGLPEESFLSRDQ